MTTDNLGLRDSVYRLMETLPDNRVTTYGDLAAMSGRPRAARIVGAVAHGGPDNLPWHRLVHSDGRLAVGFPGGVEIQRQLLERDGIKCSGLAVANFQSVRWRPWL